ncbi:ChbG/HpnK family deacetylase [Methylocella tundrae]|uniref:YdjC family protein n=1 Tax=Methylocella tundrae TaxID=227605 RepID=A0A4U8YXI2_METTU|nr:ChbG/HpnK family deacetylase [Methylocella tundrae]WPP05094.1 ChbG/HpnK family deacetylase [Methylocella tundrae]VFU07402.1 YdjC family protein [Methylocella tundrae]
MGVQSVGGGQACSSISLCADDFALSPGVNRGVIEALDAGRISATSVMANRRSWAKGGRALRRYAANADIGLHLNLTLGAPLSFMPRFAPTGHLPEITRVLKAARKGDLPEMEIRHEIARQLDEFFEHFGAPPDFVDGHQHVQILPQIRHWLLDELEARNLKGKIWLRNSADRPTRILRRGVELKKALGIAWLAKGFSRAAAARGFATNEGFSGFSQFDPCSDYARDFETYLRAPGRRHLIMCHPGYCDEELILADPVTLTRERELNFLLSPAFADLLRRASVKLARMSPPKLEIAA